MNRSMGIPGVLLLVIAGLATHARAQGNEQSMAEIRDLVNQVRRNMVEAEREIDATQTSSARGAAEQTKSDIDEIVERLKRRGSQITSDIDEIIEKIPRGGGGGGQSQQNQGQQSSDSQSQDQSGSRDRNERENEGRKPEDNRPPQEGGNPESGQDNPEEGRNSRGSRRPPSRRERTPAPDDAERWGFLPKERRQRLLDRNFREFTPEYQKEIRAYFRRLSKPKR